jgi:hypothetical protein
MNSHVKVPEVDGGVDEARGGLVAGALPGETEPPPSRQRPADRAAPPPAHSAGPDDQIKLDRAAESSTKLRPAGGGMM